MNTRNILIGSGLGLILIFILLAGAILLRNKAKKNKSTALHKSKSEVLVSDSANDLHQEKTLKNISNKDDDSISENKEDKGNASIEIHISDASNMNENLLTFEAQHNKDDDSISENKEDKGNASIEILSDTTNMNKDSLTAEAQQKLNKNLLTAAADGNHGNVIKHLNEGAEVNAKDKNGDTALCHAVRNPRLDLLNLVNYLLDRGADCNVKNNNYWSVLHIAINGKNPKVIQALVERGAKIDVESYILDKNHTPLSLVQL